MTDGHENTRSREEDEEDQQAFGAGPMTKSVSIFAPLYIVGGLLLMMVDMKKTGLMVAFAGVAMIPLAVAADLALYALFRGLVRAGEWAMTRWNHG